MHPEQAAKADQPPPRRSYRGVVLTLVVLVVLICGCVGAILFVPAIGSALYSSARDRPTDPFTSVRGNWASRDGTVTLFVSDQGDLTLNAPRAYCYASITAPGDRRYGFTVEDVSCSYVTRLDKHGTLTLNAAGDQLTLEDGSLSVVLVRKA